MNCDTCNVVMGIDKIPSSTNKRKNKYCSENCRLKWYQYRNLRERISNAIQNNSYDNIPYLTIGKIQRLGFKVEIKV